MIKTTILRFFIAIIGLSIIGASILFIVLAYFSYSLPRITSLSDYKPPIPSKILCKDGTVLAEIGLEKREIVNIEDIPQIVIDAFLSAEDDSFFEHKGIDYLGIARAMVANLKAGKIVQGGSTITQQVAKSLLLSNKRSITRKIKDFLLARQIEKYLTKQEILYLYLNQVYLGGGYYGINASVRGYFEKGLEEVTIAEAAMIAGLLVAPGRYSPYRNPRASIRRQRYVLRRMFATKKITEKEYEKALQEIIRFRKKGFAVFKSGHFSEWIRQRIVEAIGEKEFATGGYQVETTIDAQLQQLAEKSVYLGVKTIDKRQGFIGSIGHIKKNGWEEFLRNQRIEIYAKKSNYFTVHEGEIKDEFSFDEKEWERLEEHKKNEALKLKNKRFIPGMTKNDPIIEHFDIGEDKYYQAIVMKIDDAAKIIYVNVAGVMGIIPHDNFKWAHKRIISTDKRNTGEVLKPSTIVKKGDIVLVTIQKKLQSLYSQTPTSFQRYIKNRKNSKVIRRQKYLLCFLDQKPEVEGALVALSPFTGDIVAFVGGANFSKSQFNRVIQSQRQPGSAFKPIIYAAALENGFTPNSIIIDSPEALGGVDQFLSWKPRNYDGKFKGLMTLRTALEISRNIPTIKIAQDIGVKTIIDYANRIGIKKDFDKDLSISLGSFGINLMNLTKIYGIFPNGGKKILLKSLVSVTDRQGNKVALESEKTSKEEEQEKNEEQIAIDIQQKEEETNPFLVNLDKDQVYDPKLAYLMTNMLKGVILHGTGRSAKNLSSFLGGKTGTTNNYIDAWFIGFSSNLVAGVWTGFDDNKTLGMGETGSKAALPIWKQFMAGGLKKYGERDFALPQGIINVAINKKTGRPAISDQSNTFIETFVEGYGPSEEEEKYLEITKDKISEDVIEDDAFYNQH